jgi:dTDP-4-amino-4,6-dideoxygalactose transaminase
MHDFKTRISYNPIDSANLEQVLNSYNGRHHNEIVSGFEDELKEVTGSPHALALNSGTSAIHLALRLLGIGPGDEILASTFTYVATINPILYERGVPVFIDSEKDTWNMDPNLLEDAIQKRVKSGKLPKAILVVHCYGVASKMDEILSVSRRYQIPVIEDAAEALGSEINKKKLGTLGMMGVLSFNNNKIVTTYGGGALLTASEDLYKRASQLSSQSREPLPYYFHRETGYNYKMSPLNAACGISQLKGLNDKINFRRASFQRYFENLSKLPVEFAKEMSGAFSNRWISAIAFKSGDVKRRIEKEMLSHGIEVRPLWNPMHKQPVFKDYSTFGGSVSESLFERGLCLPSNVSESAVDEVVELINRFMID